MRMRGMPKWRSCAALVAKASSSVGGGTAADAAVFAAEEGVCTDMRGKRERCLGYYKCEKCIKLRLLVFFLMCCAPVPQHYQDWRCDRNNNNNNNNTLEKVVCAVATDRDR